MSAAPEEFFAESTIGLEAYRRLRDEMLPLGVTVRTTKSQVGFVSRRPFAFLWLPGRYLRHPRSPVVLSIALPRRLPSHRFAQVVEPAPGRWMHHLDIHSVADLDDEVAGWLRDAAAAAQ
ncbi:hypothetical protein HDC37_002609 [Microbacterium sp. AK009]|uniref:DUF5655 domain-containing protein n=1 Tax=Microbacterium sp. AK009 TaxID=2723068 RepID=UPI0015C80F83|nr:DUF5655 domain-containing protein [Microbacterium sp. AK009]NYF17764.1 hypothetical protein [Microbacterium sp. AK009]